MAKSYSKSLTKEDLKLIKEYSDRVYNMAEYNATKDSAKDVAEYWAYELLSLSEWMSPNIKLTRYILAKIIETFELPHGTCGIIKRQCSFAY